MLQDIKFPMSLDVFELCTVELQQRLIPARDKFKAEEDKRVEVAQMVNSYILLLHLTLLLSAHHCLLFYKCLYNVICLCTRCIV